MSDAVKMIADRQTGDAERDRKRLKMETERLEIDKVRIKQAEELDTERLTLEKERNRREAAALEQRLRIELERNNREEETMKLKRKREDDEASLKKLEVYNKLLKSDSIIDRAYAKKMEAELIDELGLKDYM